VASVGVVTTTIMAVRATPKAIKILKEAELEKGGRFKQIRNYSSGWTDLYSFRSTGSFNHRMYLWGKRIKSKETSIFDECLCHA
jgi:hypothetical protein